MQAVGEVVPAGRRVSLHGAPGVHHRDAALRRINESEQSVRDIPINMHTCAKEYTHLRSESLAYIYILQRSVKPVKKRQDIFF